MHYFGLILLVDGNHHKNAFTHQSDTPHWKWVNEELKKLEKARLHLLTLDFDEKQLEKDYRHWWIKSQMVSFRVGVLIIILLLVLTDFFFSTNYPQSKLRDNMHIERVIRYCVMASIWVLLFGLSFIRNQKILFKFSQLCINISSFISAATILVMGFFMDVYWYGLVGVYLANFFLIKLRFRNALLHTGIVHLAFTIIAFVHGTKYLVMLVFLFSIFITSCIALYFLETYSRKNFLDQQILAKEKERLNIEQSKSQDLLMNLLPASIAERLKSGEQDIASRFEEVSILFVHIAGKLSQSHFTLYFSAGTTKLMSEIGMEELFIMIHRIFSKFDECVVNHKLEKIKTIGATYMVAGNLPTPLENHLEAIVELAFDMLRTISEFSADTGHKFSLRVGINVGPVVAGVIGTKKWAYDLWGDVGKQMIETQKILSFLHRRLWRFCLA